MELKNLYIFYMDNIDTHATRLKKKQIHHARSKKKM